MRKRMNTIGAWSAPGSAALMLMMWAGAAFAQQSTLSGAWQLEISSPQGTRTPSMVLTQAGTQVTGTYRSSRGEVPVTGTITGADFALTVRVRGQDQQELVIEYQGRVEGDAMQGRIMMGARGEVAFTGKRATS